MRKYKIYTIGCKVAQAESGELTRMLERFGYHQASPDDTPDLCLVNSCAVTLTAAGKSRRLIFKLARLYPHCQIALLGCYATLAEPAIRENPHIALIADHRQGILAALEHFLSQQHSGKSGEPLGSGNIQGDASYNTHIKPSFTSEVKDKFPQTPAGQSFSLQSRHRAFLKVQDGCNAGCTYCIIPHLRPDITSVPQAQVLERAQALVADGHKEIVLTGIFLGAYGKTTTRKSRFDIPGEPLAELIDKILQIKDLGRLRLSSLEPMDLTPSLLKVLSSSDKVAGHLHLPLQAGSDQVLWKMGRQYRSENFLAAVRSARSAMPRLAMTTDIIVGFPGETEEDFQKTLEVSEKSEFMKIHIFPFSPRPGTPAAEWKDRMIDGGTMEDRLARLNDLEKTLARRFRDRFSGQTVRVLVEKVDRRDGIWYCQGRADEYFMVRFAGRSELDNEFCRVKITDTTDEPLIGQLISESETE
jgi:threonylcarbamoyladenosine tRNA methylthiotransferase MtaB